MRTPRKLPALALAIIMIVSAALIPAMPAMAQTAVTFEESKVIDWDWVREAANSERVSDYAGGERAGNPGPLIDYVESLAGVLKHELVGPTAITGPAIARIGIYNNDLTVSLYKEGFVFVSCDGTFNSKTLTGEAGTCLGVVPENVTVHFSNTGAVNRLKDYNGTMPEDSESIILASKRLAYPATCIDALEISISSFNDINALNVVADSDRLAKVRGTDGYNKKYIILVPTGKYLMFWTSSDDINGKVVLLGRDPGTGQVYQAESGLLIVNGSFGGMAICSPVTVTEVTTVTNSGVGYEVSEEAMVPVTEVYDLLNNGEDLNFLVQKYPNAAYVGPTSGNSAMFLLFADTNPDEEVWMSVGEGGQPPFINKVEDTEITSGMTVLMLSEGMDPDCKIDYWLDVKPVRCTPATE